jgi:hypothetical protein
MIAADFSRAREAIGEDALPIHRAPYGIYSWLALKEVRERGWEPVLWSRWGRDWRRSATPQSIAATLGQPVDGDILLLHDADDYSAGDSWRSTVQALPGIIDTVQAAGLEFVAL